MEYSGSSSCTGAISEGSSGASSSCLEGITMVSENSENIDRSYIRLIMLSLRKPVSLNPMAPTSSASHMAHLRDKF